MCTVFSLMLYCAKVYHKKRRENNSRMLLNSRLNIVYFCISIQQSGRNSLQCQPRRAYSGSSARYSPILSSPAAITSGRIGVADTKISLPVHYTARYEQHAFFRQQPPAEICAGHVELHLQKGSRAASGFTKLSLGCPFSHRSKTARFPVTMARLRAMTASLCSSAIPARYSSIIPQLMVL